MVFDKLLEILKQVMPATDASKVNMDSRLIEDLGVDSLNMMLLAITVEDEFGIRFDKDAKLEKVSDIVAYVESHK